MIIYGCVCRFIYPNHAAISQGHITWKHDDEPCDSGVPYFQTKPSYPHKSSKAQ